MRVPRLHLVTDPNVCPFDRLLALLPELVAAGLDAVHLRARDVPTGTLLGVARALRRVVVPPAMLFVNDRVDLALLSEADGLHLPELGLPVDEVRRLIGGGRAVGRSVHSVAAAGRAVVERPDFLVYGNVFETASKPGLPARGLDGLRAVVRAVPFPVIAIGGITPERVPAVLAAGAYGVAVIRGILGTSDPVEAVRVFRQALDGVEER
ncbi:MAG: thiamine phosphate synthase [Thermomicrobium sp.]|nr:thiamine phosphate synthase [Thermomicrobium sp.]MDW8060091.1 thiamine phosphate synthase [Thermomicrobium sp.]